jgi:repressor LexA
MRTKKEETKEAIKTFLDHYYEEYNRAPSIREIEEGTGVSRPTVQRYLAAMGESGEIIYSGRPRGAATTRMCKENRDTVMVGLIGQIACGQPNFAEECVEEYFRLPTSLVGQGEFYFLRAFGESMVEAGIQPGDMVLIRHQQTARPGDIVVALVNGETTLKRFYPEPRMKRIRLHPENASMEDIYVDSCEIQGVAVMALKDLQQ